MSTCFLTITVLTYNSQSYISQTLQSISIQARKDIQVIISDDCSTDNTNEIISEWKLLNENLFYEVVFIQSESNTGVVENKKRTFQFIKGEWTKGVAGDDLLHPDAIYNMRKDISLVINAKVIVGRAQIISEGLVETILIPNRDVTKKLDSVEKIKNFIFEGYTIPAITLLVKSELLFQNHYFEYAKKNFEDVPFHLALLTDNIQFHFRESIYIYYRKHASNLSSKGKKEIVSKYYVDYQKVLFQYALKNKKVIYAFNSLWNLFFGYFIVVLGNKWNGLKYLFLIRKKLQPKRFKSMISKPF